jgi:pyrophosphatase PpaX
MTTAFRTYLFDLDGTLIDSVDLILTSFRHTMARHLGHVPPEDTWLHGLGTPLRAQFRRFTDDPALIETMMRTYQEHNAAHHDALVREYPGVRDAVLALRERGARLGVVTSKKRDSSGRGLARCRFDGVFDVVITADDVERHKPDPYPVQRALELSGAEPPETVFVGDSPHDLVAGRGAGVATAAVLWGPFPRAALEPHAPTHWVREPSELLTLAPTP